MRNSLKKETIYVTDIAMPKMYNFTNFFYICNNNKLPTNKSIII